MAVKGLDYYKADHGSSAKSVCLKITLEVYVLKCVLAPNPKSQEEKGLEGIVGSHPLGWFLIFPLSVSSKCRRPMAKPLEKSLKKKEELDRKPLKWFLVHNLYIIFASRF